MSQDKKFSPDQEKLMRLAMGELDKVLGSLREGKVPQMSGALQQLSDALDNAKKDPSKMSEEEAKNFAESLIKTLDKLEE